MPRIIVVSRSSWSRMTARAASGAPPRVKRTNFVSPARGAMFSSWRTNLLTSKFAGCAYLAYTDGYDDAPPQPASQRELWAARPGVAPHHLTFKIKVRQRAHPRTTVAPD